MRIFVKIALNILLCGLAVCSVFAQKSRTTGSQNIAQQNISNDVYGERPMAQRTAGKKKHSHQRDRTLNQDDRLALLASALDSRIWRNSEPDCSHLVHAIYGEAGFPYNYAPSSDLYAGADGFERVKAPQAGDLVVWRGHVGIVVKPSQHIFFSFLSSGPGTDDYEAPYWRHRGRPRFYRYVKKEPAH
jgi:NlpC/P60 family